MRWQYGSSQRTVSDFGSTAPTICLTVNIALVEWHLLRYRLILPVTFATHP